MNLNEIKKPEPLARMAYNALRDSILSNTLTSGVIYNEQNLAKQLGISRTPVREALLELSSQGLMEFLPRKGVVVNTFKPEDVDEIFELRNIIESHAFLKACTHPKELDLPKIKEILKTQQRIASKNKGIENFMEKDREFHTVFARATGNRRLIGIMENIRDMIHIMGSYALFTEGRMKDVVQEHEKILDAVIRKDADTVLDLLALHLKKSKKAVYQRSLSLHLHPNPQRVD